MTAHLIVMYPAPKSSAEFDRAYREVHLPYAGPRMQKAGATGVTSRRVAPGAPYYAISDITFPTLEALQACAASTGGKEALANAASISTGGAPVVMITTDDLA